MPALYGVGNAQYFQTTTNGTNTINPGQAAGPAPATSTGVFYGATLFALGTAPTISVFDVVPPTGMGTNTTTQTNTLMNGTGTAAGQNFIAGIPGVGVRYRGQLVIVTGGTAAGGWNALWD